MNNFRAAAYKYINNNFIVVVVVGGVDMWICLTTRVNYSFLGLDNSVKSVHKVYG